MLTLALALFFFPTNDLPNEYDVSYPDAVTADSVRTLYRGSEDSYTVENLNGVSFQSLHKPDISETLLKKKKKKKKKKTPSPATLERQHVIYFL